MIIPNNAMSHIDLMNAATLIRACGHDDIKVLCGQIANVVEHLAIVQEANKE